MGGMTDVGRRRMAGMTISMIISMMRRRMMMETKMIMTVSG
jgi:hypothetical protein